MKKVISIIALASMVAFSSLYAQKRPQPTRTNTLERHGPISNYVVGIIWADPGAVSRVVVTWSRNVIWRLLNNRPIDPGQQCQILFDGKPVRGMLIKFPTPREGDGCRPYLFNFYTYAWGATGQSGGSFYICTSTESATPICRPCWDRKLIIASQYAQKAVAQNRENIRMRCGYTGPRWSNDYNGHFNWRLTATQFAADNEARARENDLNRCRGQANKRVLADQYARQAVAQNQENLRKGCGYTGPRWSNDYQGHFNYYMDYPDRAAAEARARAAALRNCRR